MAAFVAAAASLSRPASERFEVDTTKRSDAGLERLAAAATKAAIAGAGREPADVGQKHAEGDGAGVTFACQPEPGQVALHWRGDVDAPLLGQLHHGQRGDRLGRGAESEPTSHTDSAPSAGGSEAAGVERAVQVDDCDRQTRKARPSHLHADVVLDRSGGGRPDAYRSASLAGL